MLSLYQRFNNTFSLYVVIALLAKAIIYCGASSPMAAGGSKIVNEYFDKRLPDEETLLTDADFQHDAKPTHSARKRREATDAEAPIDDSAMYSGNRFEGDIVNPGLTSKTLSSFIEEENNVFIHGHHVAEGAALAASVNGSANAHPAVMRNAVRQQYLKWPNGRIPYTISKQYTTTGRQRIAEALKEYKDHSCIEFTPKTAVDVDYVHILPDEGCYSLVGKVGGKQPVSIGNGCVHKGIIIHELMHAVGFFHEQSRADRDEYIKVKWENVERGLEDQFDKYSLAMIDHLGTKYDYGSVMHYGASAFSRNGKPTIETIQSGVRIGQRVGFSAVDVYKINKLYACPNTGNASKGDPSLSSSSGKPILRTVLSITGVGGAATVTIVPAEPMPPSVEPAISQATPLPAACVDLRSDCETLAARGHCESIFSSAYMSANCVRSCERCANGAPTAEGPTDGGECRDRRTWCPGWAASGLCDFYVFQAYMHDKCALSCGICKQKSSN